MTSFELYTTVMPGVERASEAVQYTSEGDLLESRARRALNVVVAAIGLVIAAPRSEERV